MLSKSWGDRVYSFVWMSIGAACLGAILWRSDFPPWSHTATVIAVVAGVFSALLGASHLMRWPMSRVLSLLAGLLLFLYAIVAVLLGAEDVGGAQVAIPFSLGLAGLGVWSLAMFAKGRKHRAA